MMNRKNFSRIFLLLICIILFLESCKSVDSYLNNGEYQEAYNLATDVNKKEEIIDIAYKKNEFDEIYKIVKTNISLEKKFIERMLDDGYAYKCYEIIDDEIGFDYLADKLVEKQLFLKMPDVYKQHESLKIKKYNYLSIVVKKCIEYYYNDFRFRSNKKSEENTNKIIAINNIRDIYMLIKQSEYEDEHINDVRTEANKYIDGAKISGRICISTNNNLNYDIQEIVNNPFIKNAKSGINDCFSGEPSKYAFSYGGILTGYKYWSNLENFIDKNWIDSLKKSMTAEIARK